MSTESAPSGKPEGAKLTWIEQVKQKIEDLVKSAEVGTPRGMAIRDFIDNDKAHYRWTIYNHDTLATLRYALTDETIRQRKNGVIGYKKEFEGFKDLAFELGQALITNGIGLEKKGESGFTVRVDHQYFDELVGNK